MVVGLRRLFYFLLMMDPACSFAQVHHNLWLRTTLLGSVAPKCKLGLELQHRRQDEAGGDNPLAYNLLYSVRPWLLVQYRPSLRVEISPISFFRINSPVNAPTDVQRPPQLEYRSTVALQIQKSIGKGPSLIIRPALEYRMLEHHTDILRFRTKFQLQQKINTKLSVFGYEELLLNVLGTPVAHLMDQNRVCGGLQWKPGKHTSVELGYIYLSRLPATGDLMATEHNFFVQYSFLIR